MRQRDPDLALETLLRNAVADAELLHAFAVSSQVRVDDKVLANLQDSVVALGPVTPDTPADPAKSKAFWSAYNQLASAMHPVSAASIRLSSQLSDMSPMQTVHSAPFWWATSGVLVFVITLVLQSVWVSGHDLEAAITEARTNATKLGEDWRRTVQVGHDLAYQIDLAQARKVPANAEGIQALETQLFKQQQAILGADAQYRTARATLSERLHSFNDWYSKCYYLWENCRAEAPKATAPAATAATSAASRAQAQALAQEVLDRTHASPSGLAAARVRQHGGGTPPVGVPDVQPPFVMDVPAREATHRWLQARDEYVALREADPQHIGLRVHLLLQSLGTYLIPMLFGLLGTISFMLRRLIQQISDYTYLGSPVSLNLMRCGLGMIGGVVGTLVMGTNESGPLKSLPPLALPFVFGYGVEIVFAGLDRVVSSFTTVTKPSPGK